MGELGSKADSFDKDPNSLKIYIIGSGSKNLEVPWLNAYIEDSLKTEN